MASVSLPEGLEHILDDAFSSCTSLSNITLPNSLKSLGWGAFEKCTSLKSIVIPDGVTQLPWSLFSGCTSLEEVTLSKNLKGIQGYGVFKGCTSLKSIVIPEGVTGIYEYMFSGCKNLVSISLPSTLEQISQCAFSGCSSLTTITIPEKVKSLNHAVFSSCTNLTSIVLPAKLGSIDSSAFKDCTALSDVYYTGTKAQWDKINLNTYGNKPLTSATLHCMDEAHNFTGTYVKPEEDTIILHTRPAEASVPIWARNYLPDVTISALNYGGTIPEEGYVITKKKAMQGDITLSKDGYWDYIIPAEVSAGFSSIPVGHPKLGLTFAAEHTAYIQLDRKDGKPYISTVFGRAVGSEASFLELRHESLSLYKGATFDIYITAVGMQGKNPTYYIGQDAQKRVASSDGVFSSVDLYNALDFGKDVYAYVIAEDGTTTDLQKLKITKEPGNSEELEAFLKSTTFSLVGKGGQSVEFPEDFPIIGGGKLSLAAFQAPMGIYVNGSDIKITFGINIFEHEHEVGDRFYEETLFKDFKEQTSNLIKNKEKAKTKLSDFQYFKERYGHKLGYGSPATNWTLDFLGYAEGSIVNGEILLKEVLMNLEGQFLFHYDIQFASTPPAYVYAEASASLGFTTQWARFLADPDVPLDFGFILDFVPALKLGGGAGVKDALSAGIWGKGSIPYRNNFTDQYHILKLAGEFGWEAEFFVFNWSDTLLQGEYVVFENYYGKNQAYALRSPVLKAPVSRNLPAVTVSSRSYSTSSWLGESAPMTPYAVAASGVSFRDLQQDVFDRSQPQIAPLGDGLIMVWVEDDTSRDTYNRMRLVYSLYDPNSDTWSQAKPVSDNGCNDGYPSLVSDGTNVYVAWQKIDKKLTAKDCTGLDVLMDNSEVYLAKFDRASGNFGTGKKLTDNALYEYAPTVVLENGEAAVYYASASGKELNTAGKTTLYRQTLSGAATAVASSRNYILGIDAADDQISYVMDTDGDTSTTNDITVYTISGGTTTAFHKAGNDTGYTYAAYADLNGKNTLFVSDMQNIYYNENGETKRVFPTNRSIAGNLDITTTSAGTAILWTETEEGWNELYAVSYEDGAWTEPVKISDQNERLTDVAVTALNGKLAGVCNATAMAYDYSHEMYNEGKTDLCFFLVNEFTDLALSSYFYVDESAVIPGQDHSFDVLLTNKGTTTVNTVQFTLTDSLGTSHTMTRDVRLLPGVTDSVTISYPVPANYSSTTLSVTASIPGSQDIDLENNSASLAIGKPELSVTETSVHSFDDGYILKVAVENGSAVAAEGITLDVILGSKDNAPVYSQNIGTLDRYTYSSVDIALGLDKLSFDEKGVAKVYLRVQGSAEDAADADNVTCVLLLQERSNDCGHPQTQTVPRKEPSCTQPGHTSYEQCTSCAAAVSGYVEIPACHSYESVVTQPSCTEGGKTTHTCRVCYTSYTSNETSATGHRWKDATCKEPKTCKICKSTEGSALDHVYENGSCIHCGEPEPEQGHSASMTRISGSGRCQTAIEAAKELKKLLGGSRFNAIVVADGDNYPDALSGSYLAAVAKAPILLVQKGNAGSHTSVLNFIKYNLNLSKGTIYILGGKNSVSEDFENSIASYTGGNVKVVRLAGSGRYATSLKIIQEADKLQGKKSNKILVCDGTGYADSLSASATGLPVLLVNGKNASLTAAQISYLKSVPNANIFVIGGKNSVSEQIRLALNKLDADGNAKCLSGSGREQTSVAVAKEFFPNPTFVVLADGNNYPDGLSGGPLAYAKRAPLLLIREGREAAAKSYIADRAKEGYILGGKNSVSDTSVKNIFGANCLIK